MEETKKPGAEALKKLLAGSQIRETSVMSQDEKDRETDRGLKKTYAFWVLGILIGQLLLMNAVFIMSGLGLLNFEEWSLKLYLTGTLAEVFGIVLLITKHLFPHKK